MPGRAEADAPPAQDVLRAHVEGRCVLHVPALLVGELTDILVRGRSRRPAARLALAEDVTAYDARYVAPAESPDCEMVTADERRARKTAHLGRVRLLARDAIRALA